MTMSIVIVNILQNWLENNYAIPAKPNFHIKKHLFRKKVWGCKQQQQQQRWIYVSINEIPSNSLRTYSESREMPLGEVHFPTSLI